MPRAIANLIGFDDAPFEAAPRHEPVKLVGVVVARDRLDGVVLGEVTRDGDDATDAVAALLEGSRFDGHVQAVLLQGIAFGGFNVVDLPALAERLARPVIVVARKEPRWEKIRSALEKVPGGAAKWARIERAGPMEPLAGLWVQRAGIDAADAEATLALHARHGSLPEPLRVAHLLGAALVRGHSHGGA